MTLPSRRKRPTTAPNIRHRGNTSKLAAAALRRTAEASWSPGLGCSRWVRRAALSTALAAMLSGWLAQPVNGQQPQWRPSRIPQNSHAQPLSRAPQAATPHHAARPQSPAQVDNQAHAQFDNPAPAEFDNPAQLGRRDQFGDESGTPAQSVSQAVSQPSGSGAEQLGSGVVLRWKTVSSTAASQQAVADATRLRQQAGQEFAQAGRAPSVSAQANQPHATLTAAVRGSSNPLRSQVRQAAYQQSNDTAPQVEQLAPPALPPSGSPMPSLPDSSAWTAPQFGTPQQNDQLPGRAVDPLQTPELPPPPGVGGTLQPQTTQPAPAQPSTPQQDAPQLPEARLGAPSQGSDRGDSPSGSILEEDRPGNPFPPQRELNSPSDVKPQPELIPPPRGSGDQLPPRSDDSSNNAGELKRRSESTSSGYCNEMRARIHAAPLSEVSLDISPKYGAGFRAKKDPEQQRLDFASSASVREWTDYRGQVLGTGRLIDLRDDRVVIDIDGREQLIPVRDLSDVDVTYVGESWNIPERCGTGYDPLRGRNFVPATVQWTASGLCHKPLYFEQVQLERYGHETGPVLQPLISTAHFFGNIAVLPYKMGIHPPNECQYALGYFRPGNCAPYMMQPIPWSLRGAAAQAAVVTGGAALIP